MKTVGIYWTPSREDANEVLRALVETGKKNGVTRFLSFPCNEAVGGIEPIAEGLLAMESDLVISVGGDGTLLGAARLLAGTKKPLWSIHTGSLGFLTEALPSEIGEAFPRLLRGEFKRDDVELIEAAIFDGDIERVRTRAFNEITVESGGRGRLVSLSVEIDGQFVMTIDGNGIIVSTPAGSTAYNLSASGPIVLEQLPALIVNPICPHSLSNRPIVISSRSDVVIRPLSASGSPHLVADGQVYADDLNAESVIRIRGSGSCVTMARTAKRTPFDVLREKLGWGSPSNRPRRLP